MKTTIYLLLHTLYFDGAAETIPVGSYQTVEAAVEAAENYSKGWESRLGWRTLNPTIRVMNGSEKGNGDTDKLTIQPLTYYGSL